MAHRVEGMEARQLLLAALLPGARFLQVRDCDGGPADAPPCTVVVQQGPGVWAFSDAGNRVFLPVNCALAQVRFDALPYFEVGVQDRDGREHWLGYALLRDRPGSCASRDHQCCTLLNTQEHLLAYGIPAERSPN